jgi:alpha-glucosidase
VGFRYEFPDQPQLKTVKIGEELTEFVMAQPGEAWWNTAFEWDREEYLYNRTRIEEVGLAQTPMTLRLADGLHVAIHEAALVDYSGMNLARVEGRRFKAALTPSVGDAKVTRTAPFPTPWRTLQISDSAGGLYMSNLILNLNEPNKLGDVSWFKPTKFVGIWWDMHLDKKTWSTGPRHGATTAETMRYIDFAAAHGFGGVLVEGWNKGWDGEWFGHGDDFSFTEPAADFDLKKLAAYAKSKHVQLIGHHETGANAARYESQMEAAFALDEQLGINAVKTGYVSDAAQAQVVGADGKLHLTWHESQDMARHYVKVAETAARHHVAIDSHEPIKDTGLRRTYPNWVAGEGARGQEYNAWGNPTNPPEHTVIIPFTRMLGGPMDFTPGIFDVAHGQQEVARRVQSTVATQLAEFVVLYSPIQMAADLPENYEARLDAFQFIRDVPTDWETSRTLQGDIGEFIVVARLQRGGRDWFLGALTNEKARTLTQGLSFLASDKRFEAQIYRDGPGADYRTNPQPLTIEHRIVTSKDSILVDMAPGGGAAVRFRYLD